MGDRGVGEDLTEVAIDVGNAVAFRNLREIAQPVDPAGRLELFDRGVDGRADTAHAGMIDDEIEVGPVPCGPRDVVDIGVRQQAGPAPGRLRREQALVNADIADARLHHPFVAGIDGLLVVEPPRMPGGRLLDIVADGVTLPGIGPKLLDRAVKLVEPAGRARHEHRLIHLARGAGERVDAPPRLRLHRVGQEPIRRVVGRRAREDGDLGVAVEEDLLHIGLVHQVVIGL